MPQQILSRCLAPRDCVSRSRSSRAARFLITVTPPFAFFTHSKRQHHDPFSAATMNAAAQTSDDEFGYDFETDDEELLFQLASNASLALKPSTDAVALVAAANGAKKTVASFKAPEDVKAFHGHVYPRDAPALSPGNKGKAPEVSVWDTEQKRALSSPSSAHDPVAYPDCEQEFDFAIRD